MKEHDPCTPPEALLRHSEFVLCVARGLLVDEGRVQDVVQDTWVAALERPPDASL
ncbi:MAG: DNA-directed RNA polymerase specialized sigma24 family protein [Chlamydiales bacterium]|jgi:DNA-directed RNA polymerase specialized sigma24 family protein